LLSPLVLIAKSRDPCSFNIRVVSAVVGVTQTLPETKSSFSESSAVIATLSNTNLSPLLTSSVSFNTAVTVTSTLSEPAAITALIELNSTLEEFTSPSKVLPPIFKVTSSKISS
jgi:hypothetical protein